MNSTIGEPAASMWPETKEGLQNVLTAGQRGWLHKAHSKEPIPAPGVSDLPARESKCCFHIREALICPWCDSTKENKNQLIYSFFYFFFFLMTPLLKTNTFPTLKYCMCCQYSSVSFVFRMWKGVAVRQLPVFNWVTYIYMVVVFRKMNRIILGYLGCIVLNGILHCPTISIFVIKGNLKKQLPQIMIIQ